MSTFARAADVAKLPAPRAQRSFSSAPQPTDKPFAPSARGFRSMLPMQSAVARLPARGLPLLSVLLSASVAAVVVFAGASSAFASNGSDAGPKNVLNEDLAVCSVDPMTGYFRDGKCETGPTDYGTHTVCAKVTDEFLQYTLQQGNDLITARPEYRFPGLKAGEGWCLCAARYREALQAGVAPPVVLQATHAKTLQYVSMEQLQQNAAPGGKDSS